MEGHLKIRQLIKRRQNERESDFQVLESQDRYQFNSEHEKIVTLTFDRLVDLLQTRKLSATQVLLAFTAKVFRILGKFLHFYVRNYKAIFFIQALKVTRDTNSVIEFIREAEVCFLRNLSTFWVEMERFLLKNVSATVNVL